MTTRPELLGLDRQRFVPALAALGLFAVMAALIVTATFPQPAQGFPADASVVASIGAAMFGLDGAIPGANFLLAFEVVDLVLVAALVGAVMLARREAGGRTVALLTDGGWFDNGTDAPADEDDVGGDGPSTERRAP